MAAETSTVESTTTLPASIVNLASGKRRRISAPTAAGLPRSGIRRVMDAVAGKGFNWTADPSGAYSKVNSNPARIRLRD